jgi:hypothetical protein
MSSFAAKSGKGILLNAINRGIALGNSGVQLLPAEVVFGSVMLSENAEYDVRSSITAGPRFTEEAAEFHYDRLDLTALFTAAGVAEIEVGGELNSMADVLAAINTRHSTEFSAEDIDLSGAFDPLDTEILLAALPTSHGYKGELLVTILVEAPEPGPVVDPEIPPITLPAYLVAPTVVTGSVAVKARTAGDDLLVGIEQPVNEMTVASNGEIELAMGARVYGSPMLPPAVAGHYDVVIDDNTGDWTFPLSISLLEEVRPVTDLYAVTLNVKSVVTDKTLPFVLSRDAEGVYHFINEEFTLDIADSVDTPAGDVVQNIQHVGFFKVLLGAVATNVLGSPIGEYVLSLTASRLVGVVPAVVSEITVAVTIIAV